MQFRLAVAATMAVASVWSQQSAAQDALGWLKKIAESSRTVSYSGTFSYQYGTRVDTSRVVHYVNQAGGIFEKLETLDGPSREIVRANDHVTAYLPDARVVLIERRSTRHLPVMLPEKLSDLTGFYELKQMQNDRVGGFECLWINIVPKDKMRYGRKFCAELESGLPLRAQVYNERNDIVESFGFSQLSLGGKFSRDLVTSRYETRAREQKWRVDRSALDVTDQAADSGWAITNTPNGFRKTMEVKRTIAGRGAAISHLVFSDGLAAISVFIEPRPASSPSKPLINQGAVHIYKRMHGDHMVTALGEAPASTVMLFANSLEPKTSFPKQ